MDSPGFGGISKTKIYNPQSHIAKIKPIVKDFDMKGNMSLLFDEIKGIQNQKFINE